MADVAKGLSTLLKRVLHWKRVFHYFSRWRLDGTFERLKRVLRQRLRAELGRNPEPSAGIVDWQSAKTTAVGGKKKVRGTKRHLLVDTGKVWCSRPCLTQREGS